MGSKQHCSRKCHLAALHSGTRCIPEKTRAFCAESCGRNKRRRFGLFGLSEGSADDPSLEIYDVEECDLANIWHTHEYPNLGGDTEDYQPEGGGNSGFHSLLPLLSAVVLILGRLLVLAACREGSVIDPRR